MTQKNNFQENNKSSKVVAGIIIVAVGVALLMRNIGFILPHWLFSWPMILILVGIYTGFKHNFNNKSWIIVTGIGLFFLVKRYIPSLHVEPFFWPVILIAVGLIFIMMPGNSWGNFKKGKIENENEASSNTWQGFSNNETVESNNEFKLTSIFSGVKRNIITKNFTRGQITTIFGGAEIDMGQADMQAPSILKLEVAFGGIELIVPSNWVVQNEVQGIFHGVEDKRFNKNNVIDPTKVLILKGSCAFGGIEIKSY